MHDVMLFTLFAHSTFRRRQAARGLNEYDVSITLYADRKIAEVGFRDAFGGGGSAS